MAPCEAEAGTAVEGAAGSRADPAGTGLLVRLAPLVFLLLWSSGFGVAKIGLRYAEPLTFLTLRYGIIVLIFLPLFLMIRPPLPATPSSWLHIVVVGFLIQSVYFGLAYAGLSLGVSAGVAAVITSTQPLLVALAAPWLADERVGLRRWIGLLLGAAGAITVVVAGSSVRGSSAAGLLMCIGSTFGMAAATLYQKRFVKPAHPVTVNIIHYTVGIVTIAPVAWWTETMSVTWTPALVLALGWIAVANSVLAVSLLLFMIRRNEASRVASLFFLVPPAAALFGGLLLGETLSIPAWIGIGIAVSGVWLVSRRP